MSEVKKYIVIREFKSPYTASTGDWRKPIKLDYKKFKHGDRVSGVPVIKNGDILYILHLGNIAMPPDNLIEDTTIWNPLNPMNYDLGFDGLTGFDETITKDEPDYFRLPNKWRHRGVPTAYEIQFANSTTGSIVSSIFGN